MNKDAKLIFEAYLNKKLQVLKEAPIYGPGDLDYGGDITQTPGGGYGLGTAAKREGKSIKEVASELLNAIKTKLFKPAVHTVDGKEYQLFYPGGKMKFRADLENLIKNVLKVGSTQAKYTARVVDNLLNVVRIDAEGGTVAEPAKVDKAVKAGVEGKPVTPDAGQPTVTAPSTLTFVKNDNVRFIKEWQPIFTELPDEITIEKGDLYDSPELKNEVVEAIRRAFDDKMANDKEMVQDFIDSLKYKNSYSPSSEKKEGEGTGEEPNIEEYPEDDDVTGTLRDIGAIGGRIGYDPGGFSYND